MPGQVSPEGRRRHSRRTNLVLRLAQLLQRLDEHARILNRQLKHVVAKSERQRRAPEMLVACTEDVHSGLLRCIDVNPLANGTMGDLERQSSVCVASRRRQAACNWRSGDWVELLPLGRSSRAVRPVQRFALSRMPAIFDQEVSMTLRGPPHAAVSVLVSLMSWPTFAGQAQETQEKPAQESGQELVKQNSDGAKGVQMTGVQMTPSRIADAVEDERTCASPQPASHAASGR